MCRSDSYVLPRYQAQRINISTTKNPLFPSGNCKITVLAATRRQRASLQAAASLAFESLQRSLVRLDLQTITSLGNVYNQCLSRTS